jgi:glycosyltransferase involved in cell wall biosynthesis
MSQADANERMRILYLTNGFPFPLTSGYLRHYHLIRGLSERHEVTLLSMVGRNFTAEHRDAMTPYTRRVLTFGTPGRGRSKVRKIVSALGALLSGGDRSVAAMRSAVTQCLSEEPFDAVVFSGKRTYPAIAGLHDVPVVADICDATSVRIRGRMRHCSPARLPVLWLEYLQVRAVERRLARQVSWLVFASSRDREALMGSDGTRATIIPNGVDLDYWKRQSAERGADTIVMTGAMDYAPNSDAAFHLIQEILPLVRKTVPSAKLFIVGRDAQPDLLRAGAENDVCVTGLVPDVRPYLEQATVFAAPLRFGAGIQNKLLEAMAMGVPVVASPLAADGLRTEDGVLPPLSVARSKEEHAAEIVRSLVAARTDRAPDLEARRYVERHFDWGRGARKLEQVMASLVGRDAA